METSRLLQQITFIKEIDKLKYIKRKTKLFNSDRHENDAEHSWHLAMMAMVMAEHANVQVNILKVIKMLLIHDIVEIDAGDTFLFSTTKNHVNTEEEIEAAKRIFGMLPADQEKELIAIWEEFEAAETPEATFAKALDRFQPVLQNLSNDGGTWAEFDIELEKVIQKVGVISNGSTDIWDYAEAQINESAENGLIRR